MIQALSMDKAALEKATEKKYHLLIIDGDPAYQGVKFDFDHYYHSIMVGGYIVFDDYTAPEWPEVTAFVDEEYGFVRE